MVPILEAILKAAEKCMDVGKDIVASMDEGKFSNAVNEFYGGEPELPEWDAAIDIIKNDSTMDTEKKIQLLKVVSDEREKKAQAVQERKISSAKQIDEHIDKKGQVAKDVVVGVLTGGVSFISKAITSVKDGINKGKVAELPNDNVVAESEVKEEKEE